MANVETIPDSEETPETLLARYKEEIAYYEKEAGPWGERARKILRRYKDERSPREMKVPRFNILYSNIQTLMPAIYGKNPKADIERRFRDKDALGRVTSDVLERCTDYFINTEEFRSSVRSALFDRLTAGRGSIWSRYEPHFRDAEIQPDDESADDGESLTNDEQEKLEEVYYEEACTDYVNWADIGHNWARTWDEIWLLWKKVYLSRKELVKRFGEEIAKTVPLDYYPKGLNDQKKESSIKKAVVYELWDDEDKMVRWVHKDVPQFLDEKPDPLKLPDFFPCPKPLYSVLANDSMIPIPDYVEYQDQANELDELTSRIASITKSVKVAGVYDASAPGVERLLSEGVENKLIGVDQWAVHAEKGGLKGVMDFLPVKDIMETLLGLYEAREKVKSDLYEITGIADIIRGQGDPNETATGVNQKGKFATLRLSDSQDEMARFATDAVRNVAIIVAAHFSMDTIKKISGVKLLTNQDKQTLQLQIQQQAMMAQLAAQPPAQPPIPQGAMGGQGQPIPAAPVAPPKPPSPQPIPADIQEMLDNPTWEEVEQLLRNEPELCFKIDIETDSTIKMDQEAEKASSVEFLKAAGEFMQGMKDAPPIAQPLLAHMLMFGVRAFRVGKSIEGQFQVFADKVEKMAANAPANPPDPQMAKVQADIAEQKARADADKEDAAMDAKMRMMEMQQKFQFDTAEMKQKYDLEIQKMQMDAQLDMKKHAMTASAQTSPVIQLDTKGILDNAGQQIGQMADTMTKAHDAHGKAIGDAMGMLTQAVQGLHEKASQPKTISMQGRDGVTRTAIVQ